MVLVLHVTFSQLAEGRVSLYEPGQVWFIPINGTTIVLLERLIEHSDREVDWLSFRAFVIPRSGLLPEIATVQMPGLRMHNPYVRTA